MSRSRGNVTLASDFESTVKKYTPLVRAIAGRSLRNSADIDDCVSEVFGELWRMIADGRIGAYGDPGALVCTIAKRRAVDIGRKLRRHAASPIDDAVNETADSFSLEGSFEDSETRNELMKAIEALGMPDSALLVGRYYFGEDSKSLGLRYGLSEHNVNTRIHRAVKKLRKTFGCE